MQRVDIFLSPSQFLFLGKDLLVNQTKGGFIPDFEFVFDIFQLFGEAVGMWSSWSIGIPGVLDYFGAIWVSSPYPFKSKGSVFKGCTWIYV